MTISTSLKKTNLSVKKQTLAAIIAVIAAVAVPQLFHVMGRISGMGTAIGEIFLPMHLPILLVGMIVGPYAGAAAGTLGPLVSFAITGMPGTVMLPFMMVELCAYGILSGLLRNSKFPCIVNLLVVQIGGRIIRAAAILIAVYIFGKTNISVSIIYSSLFTGIFGLTLQWAIIPLVMYRLENKNDR